MNSFGGYVFDKEGNNHVHAAQGKELVLKTVKNAVAKAMILNNGYG